MSNDHAPPVETEKDGAEADLRSARLLRMGRQRAFAIGLSTVLLICAMWIALPHGYKRYDAGTFYLLEALVVLVCVLLNPDPYVHLVRTVIWWAGSARPDLSEAFGGEGVGEQKRTANPRRSSAPERRVYLEISWKLVFSFLIPAIAMNLYAVGILVNGTGGITASPFASYAFTMVVLGIVMAYETLTMFAVLACGVLYFILLAYSPIMSSGDASMAAEVDKVRGQYAAVTTVNLVITWFVTWVARPARRRRPTVTVAGSEEAGDGPELEIVSARYCTERASFDVASILRGMIVDGRLEGMANNDLAGDPDPNTVKRLEVVYRVGHTVTEKNYREGDRIQLP